MLNRIEPIPIKNESNISRAEEKALEEFKKLTKDSLEIKKADKSDVWVIMDKGEYSERLVLKEHLQTPTYEESTQNINKEVYKNLSKLIQKHSASLTVAEKKVVLNKEWSDAHFYALPKVNKCKEIVQKMKFENKEYVEMDMPQSLKSRPICGGPSAVTQGAAKLLDEILSPLVCFQKSYIKDEWEFVRRLPVRVEGKYKLLSCDIKALYPSIPKELGLEALEYWIERCGEQAIDSRFSKEFILELAEFVLTNNYLEYDEKMYQQKIGTSMGSIFAPTYSQLTVGYLEETKLFPVLLPSKFDAETTQAIIDYFYRFMDDGTTLFPADVDEDVFLELINSMHPSIQYTMERAETFIENGSLVQKLVFLSLTIFLDDEGNIWTDVYYKPTNTHDYLHFNSHHPDHIKKNIPHVLSKRIMVLSTKEESVRNNLLDLRKWLRQCGYPDTLIDRGVYTASLQGPSPNKDTKVLPLINTYYNNYDNKVVCTIARQLIETSKDERVQKAFSNVTFVQALKQPPNLLRTLSNSAMIRQKQPSLPKVVKCSDKRCKICKLYIQDDISFKMSNGKIWELRCEVGCNTPNIIYYLKCNFCDHYETYSGKTDDTRLRLNNHISGCRLGKSDNKFDNHVYSCGGLELLTKKERNNKEPFFDLHIMLTCNDYNKLLSYETKLHASGIDTMNR